MKPFSVEITKEENSVISDEENIINDSASLDDGLDYSIELASDDHTPRPMENYPVP